MKKHCILQENLCGEFIHIGTFLDIDSLDMYLRVVLALRKCFDTEDVEVDSIKFNRCIEEIMNNEEYSELRVRVGSEYIDLVFRETNVH